MRTTKKVDFVSWAGMVHTIQMMDFERWQSWNRVRKTGQRILIRKGGQRILVRKLVSKCWYEKLASKYWSEKLVSEYWSEKLVSEYWSEKLVGNAVPPLLVQRCNGPTAGLGYLEVYVICHANLPLGGWLMSALSISIAENVRIPLLTLILTTITSMQLLNKQAHRPLHVHTTMQPPSKITV